MFQFPGFAPGPLQAGCRAFSAAGCPIRTPADLGPFAPPRGFSQLVTSFFASGSPGIRRPPFSASRLSSAVRATSSCRACARSFLVSYISMGDILRHALGACPGVSPTFTRDASRRPLLCTMSMTSISPGRSHMPRRHVENKGVEPLTPCLQGRCSKPTELIPRPSPVVPGRVELPASTLSVWRSDQLSYGTVGLRPRGRVSCKTGFQHGARRHGARSREGIPASLYKGGVPAAPSGTATLLRLSPSHLFYPRALLYRRRTSGPPGSHGLTGGVYKARERIHRAMADARLLANPASRSRVADSGPNWEGVSRLEARRRAPALCPPHCNTCVAPDVRAVLI